MPEDKTLPNADAGPVDCQVGRPSPKRRPGPRRYLVADRRNSVSAATLDRLNWARWFTDGTSRGLYLHVWAKDSDTCHRVFCRHSDTPRLSCNGGVLHWLVDDSKTPNVRIEPATPA